MIPPDFEPLLAPGTPYLALLHAKAPDRALVLLHHAAGASPDFGADVQALLADENWRMHLIAAGAIFVAPERCPVEALWERIEAGSWVTPQLLAAAQVAVGRLHGLASSHAATAASMAAPSAGMRQVVAQGAAGA